MNIWEILGLAPTADQRAIKTAYARKLKVTRPDDDAQAYQQLREAYEYALCHAHWYAEREEQEELEAEYEEEVAEVQADTGEPTISRFAPLAAVFHADTSLSNEALELEVAEKHEEQEALETAAFEAQADASEPSIATPAPLAAVFHADTSPSDEAFERKPPPTPPPLSPEPDELVFQAHLQPSLADYWPVLEQALLLTPLHRANEYSTTFAEAVLSSHDGLPPVFIDHLARYFGWGEDFRLDRTLGAERAMALRTRVEAARLQLLIDGKKMSQGFGSNPSETPKVPEEFAQRQRFAQLARMAQWMASARDWQAVLFAMLWGAPLLRECALLTTRQWDVLGLNKALRSRCSNVIGAATRQRIYFCLSAIVILGFVKMFNTHYAPYALFIPIGIGFAYARSPAPWLELVRQQCFPERLVYFFQKKTERLALPSWVFRIFYSACALLLSVIGTHESAYLRFSQKPMIFVGVWCVLVLVWLTPAPKTPLRIAPIVWGLCLLGSSQYGLTAATKNDALVLVCLGTLVFVLAQAGLHSKNVRAINIAGFLLGVCGDTPEIGFLFAIPSVLLVLAAIESEFFVLGVVGLAFVSQPSSDLKYLLPWMTLVAAASFGVQELCRQIAYVIVNRLRTGQR